MNETHHKEHIASDNVEEIIFLGKIFREYIVCDFPRMIVHQDYPLLRHYDIEKFQKATCTSSLPVVSGCKVKLDYHPYRLLWKTQSKQLCYCVDVDTSIRGTRQQYPHVFTFIPALLFIPAGIAFPQSMHHPDLTMYVIERKKLLDATDEIESLQIQCITQAHDQD
ncbi:hypothetical protein [Desulfovibrio inopinatus]|uniref:hypothetical protein n=1 Tax=Desulfovibrio inopinatus TaxID=102109 RepID=UPI00048178FE|nr:hypothetical protein [Desulfovibrio inopinatus]